MSLIAHWVEKHHSAIHTPHFVNGIRYPTARRVRVGNALYPSMGAAKKGLGISWSVLQRYIREGKARVE